MVAPSTNTSSTSKAPTIAKPEPVMVVTPVTAPSSIVATPSVILPPVTAPEAVTFVNPPSFGVTDPITVLLITPSVILKFSAI